MIVPGVLLWLGCAAVGGYADLLTLNEEHEWRYMEYQFNSINEEADAIQSGAYYFRNNYPYDVEVVPDGRIFITVARAEGVPSSLNTISNTSGKSGGPLLMPYPDWSWTDPTNCDNIIGVWRVAQDECNRLWALDNGRFNEELVCPPKLLAFDLTNDKLVQRVDIPEEVLTNAAGIGSILTPIIDTVGENCSEINVYMLDPFGNGLVIWNGNTTWRIESPFFEPEPGGEKFSVHRTDFELTRGLGSMAITREVPLMERLAYFRPWSSFSMFYTRVVDLDLKKNDQGSIEYFREPTQLPSQSVSQAFSSQGILFFSSVRDSNILCWNRHKPFIPENIVEIAEYGKTLQWSNSIKIYQEDGQDKLWVLTNRWQTVLTHNLNFTRINFRVLSGIVQDLVSGTNCEPES